MQPVQLSLLPDQVPAPPPAVTGQLPGPQVDAAVTLLAGLIAKAAGTAAAGAGPAMSESGKITSSHLSRAAVIYVRQSTLVQLERNTESTARQYDLVNRARQLGWPREAIRVVDGDLGISGSVTGQRDGFEGMVAEVALGQVGIILALEASRLARDNAAWYRLLDLAGVCDTLVADADAVYHPALFGDRLLLGLMGIMAESELHVLRARLEGGIKNKAARGELRRGLPVGLIWGETDGEICFHPDEAVTGVLAAVFDRFAVCGSVRATWLWLRAEGLRWPLQKVAYTRRGSGIPEITWVEPTYHAVHTTLTHPAYAGAYVYGRTRKERYLDPSGALRQRARRLPRDQWEVLIPDHHPGFTDWDTYQANQARIGTNIRPQARQPGTGAVREGCALLQGLATCGTCGRKLAIFYAGPAKMRAELLLPRLGRAGQRPRRPAHERRRAGHRRRRRRGVPGRARSPPRCEACLQAAEQLEHGHDAALDQHRARSSRPATTPPGPNAATAPSTPTTGWSPAAWKPNGNTRSASSPTPRPSSPAARPHARRPSPPASGPRSWPSATTSARSGTRPPPPTRTASSCCAPCWTR